MISIFLTICKYIRNVFCDFNRHSCSRTHINKFVLFNFNEKYIYMEIALDSFHKCFRTAHSFCWSNFYSASEQSSAATLRNSFTLFVASDLKIFLIIHKETFIELEVVINAVVISINKMISYRRLEKPATQYKIIL